MFREQDQLPLCKSQFCMSGDHILLVGGGPILKSPERGGYGAVMGSL